MCMCGGFLEVGLVGLIVGYISKKIHKCKCECHEEVKHECCHCTEYKGSGIVSLDDIRKKSKQRKYKIIQVVLGIMILASMIFVGIGIAKEHFHKHNEHCTHMK